MFCVFVLQIPGQAGDDGHVIAWYVKDVIAEDDGHTAAEDDSHTVAGDDGHVIDGDVCHVIAWYIKDVIAGDVCHVIAGLTGNLSSKDKRF